MRIANRVNTIAIRLELLPAGFSDGRLTTVFLAVVAETKNMYTYSYLIIK